MRRRLAISIGLFLSLALTESCGDTALQEPIAAPVVKRASVQLISGDRQFALEGESLDEPLVVEVRDSAGRPIKDAVVNWSVNDGGIITPIQSHTDENGRTQARWLLGTIDEHDGAAHVVGNIATAFTASQPLRAEVELFASSLLRPRTYEGSRQTVHPDFTRSPLDWGAYSMHLAITPYPNGSSRHENPSMFVSRSGYRWFPEAGVTNPLVQPTSGYLSDPDVIFDDLTRELWLYYRQVDDRNRILMVKSPDGVQWSEPVSVVDGPNHTIISPSVVRRRGNMWFMWSVNGAGGCNAATADVEFRMSRNGINWSPAHPVALRVGDLMPWHIEVQWIPELNQYWALYPVKIAGNCQTQSLYLATSNDGLHWTTYPSPVLRAGDLPDLQDIVYRSTFQYDAARDEVRFWFSGANSIGNGFDWRTVIQRRSRASVMEAISSKSTPPVRLSRDLPFFRPP